MTKYAAEMLGFGDRIGTIEEGKLANLMITDGDPLDRSLYEKHRARPGKRATS